MSDQSEWMENNDKYLAALVAWIRLRLQRLVCKAEENSNAGTQTGGWFRSSKKKSSQINLPEDREIEQAEQDIIKLENSDPPPALIILANSLRLSVFDRHCLVLCASMELDTRIAGLCAKAQADPGRPYPTFALAFVLFDDPDWNALAPNAPLRYWRLLEINQPETRSLTSSALCIDERILNYLKGLNYLDDRLAPFIDPIMNQGDHGELAPSQHKTVDLIAGRIKASDGKERLPFIELSGHDWSGKQLIAFNVSRSLGFNLYAIDLKIMPGQTGNFETFSRLWHRESLLMPLSLYISTGGAGEIEKTLLKRFLERSNGLVFVDLQDAKIDSIRNRVSVEICKPTPGEQQQIWSEFLKDVKDDLPKRLAEQFSFNVNEIRQLAGMFLNNISWSRSTLVKDLWQACREAARSGMEQLATRITAKAEWENLVLPEEQKALLREITHQVAQRNRVYDLWGFREKMNRGLGISALFTGESGTGKTMAAEVIANELQLDLFRIDLSAVVNKYIGETEKNLRKLFDAAEDSGAILFFDEADALFGKRSEVKDSHDRYANIEINYLLQRMESYRGLAILATNMKSALDKAFIRRLRFIVEFPFPGVQERIDIWKKVLPSNTPADCNLDYQRLAALSMTGGSIFNVALNASFMAAQEDGRVTMPLILKAARTEFKKLERPAKESDFQWPGKVQEP
jgi:AAA+ superfamily predicted ATPase